MKGVNIPLNRVQNYLTLLPTPTQKGMRKEKEKAGWVRGSGEDGVV